jgi:signal transduction histidine kinase
MPSDPGWTTWPEAVSATRPRGLRLGAVRGRAAMNNGAVFLRVGSKFAPVEVQLRYCMFERFKNTFLSRYMGESALNYRRVSALLYIHILFLIMGSAFVVTTLALQGFTTNAAIVLILTALLFANLLLIRAGHLAAGVLIALLMSFAMLSATVYLAGNSSHMSLYNMGFFHVFVLLLAGMISIRRSDCIILGVLSILVFAQYFFFIVIPGEPRPLGEYIHDFIAINIVLGLSVFIAIYINREVNKLFGELEALNTSLEETVSERTEALVESEKLAALGGMVGGISHEINTPIGNSVTVISHLKHEFEKVRAALEAGSLSKSALEQFIVLGGQAVDAADRNLEIARNLVQNFKKIAADLHYDEPLIHVVGEEFSVIISSMQNQVKQCPGLEIRVDGPEDLEVPMYPGVFWHILTNLINNSIIHGFPDGGGSIVISYRLLSGGLHMEYSDDGAGMDSATLKQHFDPFFTTRRGQGGTGLGMNIVYNLLLKIGARIVAWSEPGRGVRYTIDFPAIG